MALRNLILPLQLIMSVITVLIIAQCSTAPFVIDNETYYIQTIKWLNEYGFVRGLANLHISLGQCSGWHILQSAFSFSFASLDWVPFPGLIRLEIGAMHPLKSRLASLAG